MVRIRCPECDKVIKPRKPSTPGKKIRCPECEHVFRPEIEADEDDQETVAATERSRDSDLDDDEDRPPARKRRREEEDDEDEEGSGRKRRGEGDEDDDDDRRPRKRRRRSREDSDDAPRARRKRKQKSGSGMGLGAPLLIGCGVLGLLLVVGLVVLLTAGRGGGLFGNPKVTEENYKKLGAGMTRAEIESILGPAKMVMQREIAEHQLVGVGGELGISEWHNGGNEIKIAYLTSPTHGKVCFHGSFSRNEPGGVRNSTHFTQGGNADQLREAKLARDRNPMR